MKLYLFHNLEQVSSNYHAGGGVVIVANDRDHAERIAAEQGAVWNGTTPEVILEWDQVVEFDVADRAPQIWVMPDAGCC